MRPVVWSIEAQRDNLEILRYIAEDNPFAAERVVDAIEDAGNKLGEFATGRPGRGPKRERPGRGRAFRWSASPGVRGRPDRADQYLRTRGAWVTAAGAAAV